MNFITDEIIFNYIFQFFNMRVLGISGSHKKDANTDILVKRAIDICKRKGVDTEFISLAQRDIQPCEDCNYCKGEEARGRCKIEDGTNEILDSMQRADAIIVGSPTYFASVSAKLKLLMDRTLPLRRDGFQLSGKLGGAIAVGGSRNGGQEFVLMQIHNWMLLHEMIVIADKETAHFGGIAVGRTPGDVLMDNVGLRTVENLAMNLLNRLHI